MEEPIAVNLTLVCSDLKNIQCTCMKTFPAVFSTVYHKYGHYALHQAECFCYYRIDLLKTRIIKFINCLESKPVESFLIDQNTDSNLKMRCLVSTYRLFFKASTLYCDQYTLSEIVKLYSVVGKPFEKIVWTLKTAGVVEISNFPFTSMKETGRIDCILPYLRNTYPSYIYTRNVTSDDEIKWWIETVGIKPTNRLIITYLKRSDKTDLQKTSLLEFLDNYHIMEL
jgi:hypothetical protein